MTDQRILNILLDDINTAAQLLQILEQEFDALSQRKLDQLQTLIDQKQPALRQLEQHSKERSQLLAQHNLPSNQQGLNQLAAQSTIGAQLLESSSQLNKLLEQCQEANLRNGRLIHSNQASVKSILNIIRGTDTSTLYDKSGSTASPSNQRPFSQA